MTPKQASRAATTQTVSLGKGLEEPADEPPDGSSTSNDEEEESCRDGGGHYAGLKNDAYREIRILFRKRFFPSVGRREWNDWKWQVRNRILSLRDLKRLYVLSDRESEALGEPKLRFPVAITPYYASLLHPSDSLHPLRRSVIPLPDEFIRTSDESLDPLGEDQSSPVPGIVHRYPDRVLFLATGFCATYCRYCTRSRMVGLKGRGHMKRSDLEKAIFYIENTRCIRDVLISGGDPLTLPDDALDWLLGRIRQIRHVEIVRIGTKVPVVLPQRITRPLVKILRKHHPLWISVHFIHPYELTPETRRACERLADAGIPLGSQTVLLKDINDNVDTMKVLVHGLLRIRVRPYYLYQCDPIVGSSHFRTPVTKGLEIIAGLRGHTSGYAVPTYVIDAPGGGGKIPLIPNYIKGRAGNDLILCNYQGRQFRYPGAFEDPNPNYYGENETLCE